MPETLQLGRPRQPEEKPRTSQSRADSSRLLRVADGAGESPKGVPKHNGDHLQPGPLVEVVGLVNPTASAGRTGMSSHSISSGQVVGPPDSFLGTTVTRPSSGKTWTSERAPVCSRPAITGASWYLATQAWVPALRCEGEPEPRRRLAIDAVGHLSSWQFLAVELTGDRVLGR